jgi:ribosomal protein S17
VSNSKNIKGPLIKTKNKKQTGIPRPEPIQFNQTKDPFKYEAPSVKEQEAKVQKTEITVPNKQAKEIKMVDTTLDAEKSVRKAVVGKNNAVKSIKVPAELHIKINVLGKFMDETKTYAILDELIKNYVADKLTERQKKQFEYMSEFLIKS